MATGCYDIGDAERDAKVYCHGHQGVLHTTFDENAEEVRVTCVDGTFGILDAGFDNEPFSEPGGDVE